MSLSRAFLAHELGILFFLLGLCVIIILYWNTEKEYFTSCEKEIDTTNPWWIHNLWNSHWASVCEIFRSHANSASNCKLRKKFHSNFSFLDEPANMQSGFVPCIGMKNSHNFLSCFSTQYFERIYVYWSLSDCFFNAFIHILQWQKCLCALCKFSRRNVFAQRTCTLNNGVVPNARIQKMLASTAWTENSLKKTNSKQFYDSKNVVFSTLTLAGNSKLFFWNVQIFPNNWPGERFKYRKNDS